VSAARRRVTLRRAAIAAAILVFLAVSALVARWLAADTTERNKVQKLLEAQARGDAGAMAVQLGRCDPACRGGLEGLARRIGRSGASVDIVRYDSKTSHALGAATAPTRVVWKTQTSLPTVQCVVVQRTGTVLSGPRVTLLRLSAPIGRESAC
jgi:hypothetical protein